MAKHGRDSVAPLAASSQVLDLIDASEAGLSLRSLLEDTAFFLIIIVIIITIIIVIIIGTIITIIIVVIIIVT